MDAQRDEQRALGDRAMKAHQALDTAVNNETFNEGAIRALAADLANVEADMAVARGRVYSQVFLILTSDQQAQLKQMQTRMAEREASRGDRRISYGDPEACPAVRTARLKGSQCCTRLSSARPRISALGARV